MMNYARFIILGEERTGSTYLQMLLASNQSILSLGELFNSDESIRRKGIDLGSPIAEDDDPIKYLESEVYKKWPKEIKAVGFKLFYTHARHGVWKALWDHIKGSDIRIIHMKRRNLLDRYVSHKLAERSGDWIRLKKENGVMSEAITLNVSECADAFHKSEWWQKKADEFFRNSQKAILFYEDLCEDPNAESKRIQEFLSLKPQKLTSITEQQRTKKKSEVIVDFYDLKHQFTRGVSEGWAKAEWINFFDET
jgi:LPS sulfotransferase NodH